MSNQYKKNEQLKLLKDSGVIAIIRAEDSSVLMKVAQAIKEGGVKAIEVTMTTPNALELIEEMSDKFADEIITSIKREKQYFL